MKFFVSLLIILLFASLNAQKTETFTWYNVEELVPGGRVQAKSSNPFQRFPDSMQKLVRERVWDLSENPAGVYLDFKTNASKITVKYKVNGPLQFMHMPATGVSGVDLYAYKKGNWKWVKGNYSFQDTISYIFRLKGKGTVDEAQRKFRLYLPLYNTVSNMQIGVPGDADFSEIPEINKLPIVVYGTSITQGACAGRPGTAWTSILSRKINIPLLNYGFSGNGRLEEEIVAFLSNIDAEVFILDCLANFTSGQGLNAKKAKQRLIKSVKKLRESHSETPVILADHAGYPHGETYYPPKELYLELNRANKEAFEILKKKGVTNIFLLKNKTLGLEKDDFIDGVHPNDSGMKKYANAYLELLNEIRHNNKKFY